MLSWFSKIKSVAGRTGRLRVAASVFVLGLGLAGGLAMGAAPALADTACGPGTYSATGTVPCVETPAGTFVSGSGATLASLCPVGQFQPNASQAQCEPAPPGSYVDTIGATKAKLCPVGTFAAVPGETACAQAPPGTYDNAKGEVLASPCLPGYYQAGSGQSRCVAAPIGTYVANIASTLPTACPTGLTTLAKASTSASACRLPVPTRTAECKNGGWQDYADANGTPFTNQADCVSYVATE